MRVSLQLPFRLVRQDTLREITRATIGFTNLVERERESFEGLVRKAKHNAYAGIVCESCKKNVFRGEGEWVHGNGGKAYCLKPCWQNLKKEKNIIDGRDEL